MMVKNRDYVEVVSNIPDLVQGLEDQWLALLAWHKKAKEDLKAVVRMLPSEPSTGYVVEHVRNVDVKVAWDKIANDFAYRLAQEFPKLINSALANTGGYKAENEANEFCQKIDADFQASNARYEDEDSGHSYPSRLSGVPTAFSPVKLYQHLQAKYGGQKLIAAVHEQAAKLIDGKCARGYYARNNGGLTRKQSFEQSFKTTKQGTDLEMRYASIANSYGSTAQKYEWSTYRSLTELFAALEIIDQDWANVDESHVPLDWKAISEKYVNENYIVFRDANGELVRKVELNERLTILPRKDCIVIRVPTEFAERIKAFCFKNDKCFDKADD